MHKMPVQMYFVCHTPLMTVKLSLGHPINHFPMRCVSTLGRYAPITPRLNGSFSGTSYKLTLTSNSSTAPLRKRVLTAYLAASKTSGEQSAATCAKTTEEANLSVHFPSLALMDRLTIRQS